MTTTITRRAVNAIVAFCLALTAFAVVAPRAEAIDILGMKYEIAIDVLPGGGATGYIWDTLQKDIRYTVTLRAVGGGTCGAVSPQVVINDQAQASGYGKNKVSATTYGACNLYNAEMTYNLTAVSNQGASLNFQRVCAWELTRMFCTPRGA